MENLNCGIYQIRNIVNGKCYIGQSIELRKRKSNHFSNLKKNNGGENRYLQNSFDKHGQENFVFEILLYCEPFELTRYEQFFVDKYKKLGKLYNFRECVDSNKGLKYSSPSLETRKRMSKNHADVSGKNNPMFRKRGKDNPNFGKHHTKETKEKISKANKNPSKKTREKISKSKMGEKNPNFGKHLSKETKEKMSKSHKNLSKETREKMSQAKKGKNNFMFGKHHSKKTKAKMSKNHADFLGKNHPQWGKHPSEETREKMRKAKLIKKDIVLKIKKMLNLGIFQKNISKKLNIGKSTIHKVKNGYYDEIYNL